MAELAQAEIENNSTWRDYLALCKPKVVTLLLVTAVVGMHLATPGFVPLDILVLGTIGIGFAAASAAVINHVVDEHIDAKMQRTQQRPMPQGMMSSLHAIAFSATLGVLSMVILSVFINPLTAILSLAGLVGYAFVYTMFLKHATPQNIVIGGISGALPPLLGWTAVTNSIEAPAILLVLIIFAWTPPHFWALAIDRVEDYKKAGVPMLPVTHGIDFTKTCIIFYTLMLMVISALPYVIDMSGLLYLVGALCLGGWFTFYTVKLKFFPEEKTAITTFFISIKYLFALFIVLLLDHYVTPLLRG